MTIGLAIALAAVFGVSGVAKLAAVPLMRQAAAHLGFSTLQYRLLGALEVAAVVGVGIGVVVPWIGIAAASGLVLLMLGAAASHAAHRDGAVRVAIPLVPAVLAVLYALTLV
ncbi:DoxX family protein [Glycomyces terrestris]|uniref:Invasion protein n=1 Tax=Glycomyces terrestris TaxID=2493553 RepID=A0A426UST1_9ACTN|nr:DoxX family protein [Glycomyces terrestris]RRR96771.1 invasion protein [Glycomyces terrestris]